MQMSRVLEWKMETECGSDNDIMHQSNISI